MPPKKIFPITTGGAGYIPPHTQLNKATIRQNLYDNLSPHSYQSLSDAFKSILGTNTGATHTLEDISVNPQAEQPINDAIWATYLRIPKNRRHKNSPELVRSKYTPSKGKDDVTYYKFPLIDGINHVVEEGTSLPIGSNKVTNMDSSSAGVGNVGDYTIGHGYDNHGEYVSMYDKWDINPFKGSYRMTGLLGDIGNLLFGNIDNLSFGIGKPVHLYDRIYLDDYYGVKEPTHSTWLPEVTIIGKKKNVKPLKRDK